MTIILKYPGDDDLSEDGTGLDEIDELSGEEDDDDDDLEVSETDEDEDEGVGDGNMTRGDNDPFKR